MFDIINVNFSKLFDQCLLFADRGGGCSEGSGHRT
jgi:hypothetical protein